MSDILARGMAAKAQETADGKAAKPSGTVTQGNIATLDAIGNLTDGGTTVSALLSLPTLPDVDFATTANDTLTGLSARDGFTPTAGQYCLVKNQTNGDQGIYKAASGAWVRQKVVAGAWADITVADTTYASLGINFGSVYVKNGTANKNRQFRIAIASPSAAFGATTVVVSPTTTQAVTNPSAAYVSTNVGNDTDNVGTSDFPFATILRALQSGTFPKIVHADGQTLTGWTYPNPAINVTVQSDDLRQASGKTQITSAITLPSATNSRIAHVGLSLAAATVVPAGWGGVVSHERCNWLASATSLISLQAGMASSTIEFRSCDSTSAPLATVALPDFTNPQTIWVHEQFLRMPFSVGASGSQLATVIITATCTAGAVRVPLTFRGTVLRGHPAVTTVSSVITTQAALDTLLANTSGTDLVPRFFLLTGFTPTQGAWLTGAIIGKQSGGGATEHWIERSWADADSVLDASTSVTWDRGGSAGAWRASTHDSDEAIRNGQCFVGADNTVIAKATTNYGFNNYALFSKAHLIPTGADVKRVELILSGNVNTNVELMLVSAQSQQVVAKQTVAVTAASLVQVATGYKASITTGLALTSGGPCYLAVGSSTTGQYVKIAAGNTLGGIASNSQGYVSVSKAVGQVVDAYYTTATQHIPAVQAWYLPRANAEVLPVAFYQTSSSTFPSTAKAGDYLNVTTDGTRTGGLKERWDFDGTGWFLTIGKAPVSGVVLDNTITNPASFVTIGRYIMPVGSTGGGAGKDNQYADYNGTTVTYTPAASGDRVSISNGPNANSIWYFNGTSWSQQSEDSAVSSVRNIFTSQAALTTWINSTSVVDEGYYLVGFASPTGITGISRGDILRKVTKNGVQTTSIAFAYASAPPLLQNDADGLPRIKTGPGVWQIPLTSAASARSMLVTKTGAQSIPSGYGRTVITGWATPTVDNFGMFNASTGVFTNTSGSTIRIKATAMVLLGYGGYALQEGGMDMFKNGAAFVGGFEYFFAPSGSTFWKIGTKFSPVITLAAGETFSLSVYQVTGGAVSTHTSGTQLMIEEVL